MINARNLLKNKLAPHTSDPSFIQMLQVLPNPDVILRKLNSTQQVYDDIMADAHVIGEVRSIRAGLLSYEWKLQLGGENPADVAAYELCQKIFSQKPGHGLRWNDITWTMAHAVFKGFAVHQINWKKEGAFLVPDELKDWKQDRFVFDVENQLKVLTKDSRINGEETDPRKWLVTRHMASYSNPYGVALMSSCFWPYTFKHSGYKYFVKFCEKYGMPWALGKYKAGIDDKKQEQDLADQLADMVEDAVGVFPDTTEIELTTQSVSGELVHERLIRISNAEISKALTSQTLATEINGNGSRAAAETHRGREQSTNESDREIIEDTYNQLLELVTQLNFPPNTNPPKFEFYKEEEARREWGDVFNIARNYMEIPKQFAHDRMQIPMPVKGEDILPMVNNQTSEFSEPIHGTVEFTQADNEVAEIDSTIEENWIKPIYDMLKQFEMDGKTIKEFQSALNTLYSELDDEGIEEIYKQLSQYSFAKGMSDAS